MATLNRDGAPTRALLTLALVLLLPGGVGCGGRDPADPAYNTLVRAPHRFGHETLRRPDPLYDVVLLTDWNWPDARPGRGSAIFLHVWRKPRHPTEGCIAVRRDHLEWIVRRVAPGSRVIVP